MKLITADYIIAFGFILMLFTHSFTQYLVVKYTNPQQEVQDRKEVVAMMEANPLAALFLQFKKLSIIYSVVIAPGFVFGIYYWVRKKYIERDMLAIETFSITITAMTLINFFNDFSYLLGFLAR